MRCRRTSTRFLKWAGLIASVAITCAWLGSAFIHVHYDEFDGRTWRWYRLWQGTFQFGRTRDWNLTPPNGWWVWASTDRTFRLWHPVNRFGSSWIHRDWAPLKSRSGFHCW
ncbi:MAG: hypothetical protein KF691_07025 [Phycisphaeraceae bacterium]|nr:hypothetical protein [Phycisphaeraceae bacterium]